MKKVVYIAAVLILSTGVFCSCSNKKKSNDIIVPKSAVTPAKKLIKSMSVSHGVHTVSWGGNTYTVDVLRKSDSSLPQAQVDENTKYYDNKITVKILRKDGSAFFSRTFLKSDFSTYVDADTKTKGALLGIVLVRAESNDLLFAVSVGSPDVNSDEYVPLDMKITRTGSVSISKDNNLDTGSDTQSDMEE
jgi:hypothetical protein